MTIINLLYHDIVVDGDYASSGFGGADADVYKLDRSMFAEHLVSVGEAVGTSRVVAADDLPRGQGRAVAFTFDDGGASAILAADMLESRGWRGYFFITTDFIDARGFLTREQIRELDVRGHVIGSHSCSHPSRLSSCPNEQLEHEWRDSVRVLEAIVGKPCRTASVPGGYYSARVARAAASSGIRVLFTSEPVAREHTLDGCVVLGRYSIQRGTSAATAAAIASGDRLPRWSQYVLWNAKKAAKRVGGARYIALRKALFSARRPRS